MSVNPQDTLAWPGDTKAVAAQKTRQRGSQKQSQDCPIEGCIGAKDSSCKSFL